MRGVVGIVAILAVPALAAKLATVPATRPSLQPATRSSARATTTPARLATSWEDPIRQAIRRNTLPQLAADAQAKLQPLLDNPALNQADDLIGAATAREFGRYFARLGEHDEGSTDALTWLAGQPRLLPVLMMSLSQADPPDRVLEVLRSLRADHEAKLDEYADLGAAMCVVWDAPQKFGEDEDAKIAPERVNDVFGHFTSEADRLAMDPRRMPWEWLVYVVDLDLGDDELRWATARREGPINVPALFAATPYSESATYDRASHEMTDAQAYTLPNIARRGGTCMDEAYVASQVAKSSGVPAVVCKALGAADGPQPAWVGFLSSSAKPAWDFTSARMRDHAGWPGEIEDPQTGTAVMEPEVSVLTGLAGTSQRDRLASMALCQSIDLVEVDKKLALLRRAIEWSPSNRSAWYALADFAAAQKLDAEGMRPVEELMQKYLQRRWPAMATLLRLRMIKGRGSIEYTHGADRAADAVKDQPELASIVRIALADRQREEKNAKLATDSLVEALRLAARSPAIQLGAMTRLDEILRKQDDLPRLAAIYKDVFAALPRPAPSKAGRTTAYYRIGIRYAAVLDELKNANEASAVRAKVENGVLPS